MPEPRAWNSHATNPPTLGTLPTTATIKRAGHVAGQKPESLDFIGLAPYNPFESTPSLTTAGLSYPVLIRTRKSIDLTERASSLSAGIAIA